MTIKTTRRALLAGSTAAAGMLAMPAVLKAQPTTLRISHIVPPTHWVEVELLRPWAEELRERTGGGVDFEIHSAASAFGRADRQADQVRAGVVDIAFGLSGMPPGRFPHSSVIELPFVVEKTRAGSAALWELYRTGHLGGEYDDFHALALFTNNSALFHTVDKPIRQLADLRGLRVRSPGPAVNAMLEYVGASPIGLPPTQIYESLEKGVIDGVATTWDLVGPMHLNEVLKHHTEARLYTSAFYILMNKYAFASLPVAARKAIDETSGEALLRKLGALWDKWDAVGKADAATRGNEIIPVDNATREAWRRQLRPMIEQYLTELEAEGVEDPVGLYEAVVELVEKHSA